MPDERAEQAFSAKDVPLGSGTDRMRMEGSMSLAAIHILKKELGLSDADYRAILRDEAGVASAAQLGPDGDRAVMRRLYAIRDERQAATSTRAAATSTRAKTPTEAKIWAIWYEIRGYLPEPERTVDYLLGFIRRASGNIAIKTAEDIATLTKVQAYHTIEALKYRLAQEEQGVRKEVPF